MPKLKSRKAAAKRVRFTKKGRVKRFKAGRGHLLALKRSKRKRFLGRPQIIDKVDEKTFHVLLPYGK